MSDTKKAVLIVEDDSFLQGLVSRKLNSEGHNVFIAGSSTDVTRVLQHQKVDLILLDLLLPRVDGFEILKQLRENEDTAKTPVIVFSNLSEEKDIKKAQDLGISAFMIKSNFTLDELSEKITEVLK